MIDPGEQCEGTDLAGQTCVMLGFLGGALACRPDCIFDVSGCHSCGDGGINPGEQCDGTDLGGQTCETLGFLGGTLACGPDCTFDVSGCHDCGDDVIGPGEECDGTDLGGETCETLGFEGGTLACGADCTFDVSGCHTCGDGVIDPGEQCDGSDLGGQTCRKLGFSGGTLVCGPDCIFDVSGCTVCCLSDSLDDGDDVGWIRFASSTGGAATFSFPGGVTYRLEVPGEPQAAVVGPARAASLREDFQYTSFLAEVDLVDWNDAFNQSIGLLGRITQLGVNTTNGYALLYHNSPSTPAAEGIALYRLDNETPTQRAFAAVDLDPSQDYRLEFRGTGSALRGRVFALSDPHSALATVTAADVAHTTGSNGVIATANIAVFATDPVDATFDNYHTCGFGIDSDADGVCDGADACPGFDDTMDADGDGVPDGCDPAPIPVVTPPGLLAMTLLLAAAAAVSLRRRRVTELRT